MTGKETGNENEIDVSSFKNREIIIHHSDVRPNVYGKDDTSIPSKRIVNCSCCNKKKYCWKRHITCGNDRDNDDYYCLDCTIHNDDFVIYSVSDSKTCKTLIDKDQPLKNYMKGFKPKKETKELPILECQWVRARDYQ